MAKKIPKAPASGASFPEWTTSLGVLSLLNRNPLTWQKITGANPASYGSSAWHTNQMANMARMGQTPNPGLWGRFQGFANRAIPRIGNIGMGAVRARALMHPGVMIPAAGAMLAKWTVDKAMAPLKDPETGRIGAEGYAKLNMLEEAGKELKARRKAAKEEGASTWELMKMKKDPSMLSAEALAPFLEAQLAREKKYAVPFHERYARLKAKHERYAKIKAKAKEDLWHKGVFWGNRAPGEKSAVTRFMDKFLSEGGIARLL